MATEDKSGPGSSEPPDDERSEKGTGQAVSAVEAFLKKAKKESLFDWLHS